jgi:cysteine desulfuration protein SufE
MPHAERQHPLIARYTIIHDPQERMAAVMERGKKWPDVSAGERTEANRIRGCASQVWLAGSFENGRCHFRVTADSALVKGLAALIAEFFDGRTPAEITACDIEPLEALGLTRQLSPTRLNGLANVRRTIREFAARHLPT